MTTRWDVERAVKASDLPPLARLVVWTLLSGTDADSAVIPEQHSPSLTALERATGLARSTVRGHLNRLERDGWIRRRRPPIALARSKHARTAYALSVPARAGDALAKPDARAGDALGLGRQPTQARAAAALSSDLDHKQAAAAASPAEKTVMAATGCGHADATAVVDLIEREKQPRKITPFVKRLADDGELPDWLQRVHADRGRQTIRDWLTWAKQQPECEHRVPGGNLERPTPAGASASPASDAPRLPRRPSPRTTGRKHYEIHTTAGYTRHQLVASQRRQLARQH